MLTDVILLSSGIHGREIVEIIRRNGNYKLLGIIRSGETQEQMSPDGIPILGGISALSHFPDISLIHDNEWSREHLDNPNIAKRLISLIDPSCFIHPSAVHRC